MMYHTIFAPCKSNAFDRWDWGSGERNSRIVDIPGKSGSIACGCKGKKYKKAKKLQDRISVQSIVVF